MASILPCGCVGIHSEPWLTATIAVTIQQPDHQPKRVGRPTPPPERADVPLQPILPTCSPTTPRRNRQHPRPGSSLRFGPAFLAMIPTRSSRRILAHMALQSVPPLALIASLVNGQRKEMAHGHERRQAVSELRRMTGRTAPKVRRGLRRARRARTTRTSSSAESRGGCRQTRRRAAGTGAAAGDGNRQTTRSALERPDPPRRRRRHGWRPRSVRASSGGSRCRRTERLPMPGAC